MTIFSNNDLLCGNVAASLHIERLAGSVGDGSGLIAFVSLATVSVIILAIRWMDRVVRRDLDMADGSRLAEEAEEDLLR